MEYILKCLPTQLTKLILEHNIQKLEEIKMNNQTMDFSFKDEELMNAVSKFPNLKHIDFYEIKNLRQYTKNIFHPKFTYLRIIDPSKSISSYLSGLKNLKELSIVFSIDISCRTIFCGLFAL